MSEILDVRITGHEHYLMNNTVELFLFKRDVEAKKTYAIKNIEWYERTLGKVESCPRLSIQVDPINIAKIETLQRLMDDLFRLGYRPTEAHAGDARVQAMKDHLEDMRRLVWPKTYKPIGGDNGHA